MHVCLVLIFHRREDRISLRYIYGSARPEPISSSRRPDLTRNAGADLTEEHLKKLQHSSPTEMVVEGDLRRDIAANSSDAAINCYRGIRHRRAARPRQRTSTNARTRKAAQDRRRHQGKS